MMQSHIVFRKELLVDHCVPCSTFDVNSISMLQADIPISGVSINIAYCIHTEFQELCIFGRAKQYYMLDNEEVHLQRNISLL
jgi:hypothetical protein